MSSAGDETITNHSSGTVDVVVAIRGYYSAPTVPGTPDSVFVQDPSQTSATVTWEPPYGDGGSPITGYTITAPPDLNSVTVGPGTLTVTLTGLTDATADDVTVTAMNAVGDSVGADDEYMTSSPDSQAIEQDIGISVDPEDGTQTLVDSNAAIGTIDSSGNRTVTSVLPDTSFVTDNADADAVVPDAPNATGNCKIVAKRSLGANPKLIAQFNNTFNTGGQFHFSWGVQVWGLNKANVDPNNGEQQWHAVMCTTGAGIANGGGGYVATISESALETDSTHGYNYQNSNFGQRVTASLNVTSQLGFNLGGDFKGASIGVNASETVSKNVISAEIGGIGGVADFHWSTNLFPASLTQYAPTRVNIWWKADNSAGRSTDPVGNVGEAQYSWDDVNGANHPNDHHTFYSVVLIAGCKQGRCGYAIVKG